MGASFLARLAHRAESSAGSSGLESESQFGTTAFFGAQPRLELDRGGGKVIIFNLPER
jgi:hypothetical protein